MARGPGPGAPPGFSARVFNAAGRGAPFGRPPQVSTGQPGYMSMTPSLAATAPLSTVAASPRNVPSSATSTPSNDVARVTQLEQEKLALEKDILKLESAIVAALKDLNKASVVGPSDHLAKAMDSLKAAIGM